MAVQGQAAAEVTGTLYPGEQVQQRIEPRALTKALEILTIDVQISTTPWVAGSRMIEIKADMMNYFKVVMHADCLVVIGAGFVRSSAEVDGVLENEQASQCNTYSMRLKNRVIPTAINYQHESGIFTITCEKEKP